MNKEIISRVEEVSDYILETQDTIRETAKKYNVSKSTIHKDIKERLPEIDNDKYLKIQDIFKEHIETRHIKGGQSTKNKYLKQKITD